MILAIDPDVKRSGCALFAEHGQLAAIEYAIPFGPSFFDDWEPGTITGLVCEKPRIYPGVPGVDANDLIDLSEVVGWFRSACSHIRYTRYYPADWKAQVPKCVHHHRVWSHLTAKERMFFPPDTDRKVNNWLVKQQKKISDPISELLDAAGIGMFHLRRTGRGAVAYRP